VWDWGHDPGFFLFCFVLMEVESVGLGHDSDYFVFYFIYMKKNGT